MILFNFLPNIFFLTFSLTYVGTMQKNIISGWIDYLCTNHGAHMTNGNIDSEANRQADRLQAIGMKKARDFLIAEGLFTSRKCTISRKWVADQLGRSECWVSDNWAKDPKESAMTKSPGRPKKFDEKDKKEVLKHCGKRKRGHRTTARLVSGKIGKTMSPRTVQRIRKKAKLTKFVIKARPLKTTLNISDRVSFCRDIIGR